MVMRTLREIIEDEFGVCDTEGVSKIKLDARVEECDIDDSKREDGVVLMKVRYEGWDNPLTHPYLREPKTQGWHTLEFGTDDGEEWFFYYFR